MHQVPEYDSSYSRTIRTEPQLEFLKTLQGHAGARSRAGGGAACSLPLAW